MNFEPIEPEENIVTKFFSDLDVFINESSIENIDISLNNENYNYVSLKLPVKDDFDIEEFLNDIETRNQNKFYIITTIVPYLDEPELKKYYIPYTRLNDFLYTINDPEYDEKVISIVQAEEEQ